MSGQGGQPQGGGEKTWYPFFAPACTLPGDYLSFIYVMPCLINCNLYGTKTVHCLLVMMYEAARCKARINQYIP